MEIGGYPATLADTAGFAFVDAAAGSGKADAGGGGSGGGGVVEGEDNGDNDHAVLEREGVRRAHVLLESAALVLYVHDGVESAATVQRNVAHIEALNRSANVIVVRNKVDLLRAPESAATKAQSSAVSVSALKGYHLDALTRAIRSSLHHYYEGSDATNASDGGDGGGGGAAATEYAHLFAEQRQQHLLRNATSHLQAACNEMEKFEKENEDWDVTICADEVSSFYAFFCQSIIILLFLK